MPRTGKKFGESVKQSVTRTMAEKIGRGTAVNVHSMERLGSYYVLSKFDPDQDYVDLEERRWIRSIGKLKTATGFADGRGATLHAKPGTIIASAGLDLIAMPGVVCIWQR